MILQLMLIRLQENRTPQLSKYFIHFLCVVAFSAHGVTYMFNILESVQPGMTTMIIGDIWGPIVDYISQGDSLEFNQTVVGGLEFLFHSPITTNSNAWIELFKILLHLVSTSSSSKKGGVDTTHLFDDDSESREFDSTYSKLAFAQIIEIINPILEGSITDIRNKFGTTLSEFCQASPGKYSNLLRNQLSSEEQNLLQELLVETGTKIV